MSVLGEQSIVNSPDTATSYNAASAMPSIMEDNGTPSASVDQSMNDTTNTATGAFASSHTESAAGAMYVLPAHGGDESATFSADSSELLNTPSGDAERHSEPDLTGTGRPQDVEIPSIYSGETEEQEDDSICPDDSTSQVSVRSRGADERQSLISNRSSEVLRASEAIKRRKLRIAESTADVEREEARLASMQREIDNRSNLSTRSLTSRTTQRKLVKAFSESAPLAPRASTPPRPRASGQ